MVCSIMLDKAKLEKRIASLEGERKSFNKGKRDSEFKLESKIPHHQLYRLGVALVELLHLGEHVDTGVEGVLLHLDRV